LKPNLGCLEIYNTFFVLFFGSLSEGFLCVKWEETLFAMAPEQNEFFGLFFTLNPRPLSAVGDAADQKSSFHSRWRLP